MVLKVLGSVVKRVDFTTINDYWTFIIFIKILIVYRFYNP